MIVYCILNMKNGKRYVGQTVSTFRKRYGSEDWWKSPTACKNRYLKGSVAKYGPEWFIWGVIETCSTKEELNEREAFWIERWNTTNPIHGYNMRAGGNSHIYNDEAKQQNREAQNKRWTSEILRKEQAEKRRVWCSSQENRQKMSEVQGCEPFDAYRISDRAYLGTWTNRTECAAFLGLHPKSVRKLARGDLNKLQGFLFVEKGQSPNFDNPRLRHGKAKPIRCVETGKIFSCQVDAAKALGLRDASQFRDYFRGRYKHVKGFQWEYVTG